MKTSRLRSAVVFVVAIQAALVLAAAANAGSGDKGGSSSDTVVAPGFHRGG